MKGPSSHPPTDFSHETAIPPIVIFTLLPEGKPDAVTVINDPLGLLFGVKVNIAEQILWVAVPGYAPPSSELVNALTVLVEGMEGLGGYCEIPMKFAITISGHGGDGVITGVE